MTTTSRLAATERIHAQTVVAAFQGVRAGTVYDLGHEINETIPQGAPGAFTPFSFTWRTTPEECARGGHAHEFAAETITGALHVGTHIDGLAHISAVGRLFDGSSVSDVRHDRGFTHLGMETVTPIIGRGLILDIPAVKGSSQLPDGYAVTIEDVTASLERSGQQIQLGDIVCVRTGKEQDFSDAERYQAAQPGVPPETAVWMYEQGMSVLGTDTTGTEPLPFPDEAHTTHRAMIVERGVHLIENLALSEVAEANIAVGTFICLPLKITGATGSWVRPVLVV